jgi:hypothetical protein
VIVQTVNVLNLGMRLHVAAGVIHILAQWGQ